MAHLAEKVLRIRSFFAPRHSAEIGERGGGREAKAGATDRTESIYLKREASIAGTPEAGPRMAALANPDPRLVIPTIGDSRKNLESKAFLGGVLKFLGIAALTMFLYLSVFAGSIKATIDAIMGLGGLITTGMGGGLVISLESLFAVLPLLAILALILVIVLIVKHMSS